MEGPLVQCEHDRHVMTFLHMSQATRYMRVGAWAKTLVPLPVELDHQVGLRFTLLLGLVAPLRYPRCMVRGAPGSSTLVF